MGSFKKGFKTVPKEARDEMSSFCEIALNSALPEGQEAVALNIELLSDGTVPEWIELIPPGRDVKGRDGRSWINDRPEGIVEAFNANGAYLPMDWEHSTEKLAPQGHPAPAAAWGTALEARAGGSIWGRFEWTEKGKASVANREYRYLSPVLLYERASRRIVKISSLGLTNKPNLVIPALNKQTKEREMDPQLLKALGLPETADLDQAVNAVKKIQGDLQTALNRAETPSLDKFVPRADYDAALAKAANAEKKEKERAAAELEAAINAEVDAALKAGKIVPATKDFYLAMCRQEGGLDQFKKFVEAAPVIADPSGLDHKKADDTGKALNAEVLTVAGMMGVSKEDIQKYGGVQ